jgi:ABC-type glycerol-3-phosphate transport system permease component
VNVLRIPAILRIPKDVNVLRSSFVHIKDVYAAASVPDELLEAARIDGSGEVRTFESLAQA